MDRRDQRMDCSRLLPLLPFLFFSRQLSLQQQEKLRLASAHRICRLLRSFSLESTLQVCFLLYLKPVNVRVDFAAADAAIEAKAA